MLNYQTITICLSLVLLSLISSLSNAASDTGVPVRLSPPSMIDLQIVGRQVTSPVGETVVVPFSATAVSLNVTVVNPTAAGFITVWPCGVSRPLSSNLNFVAGSVVPNGVVASLGSQGSVCLYSSSETDIIVDVAGWFEGDAFFGATPKRLADTRDATGGPAGQLVPTNPLEISISNLSVSDSLGFAAVVPSNLNAVALNVTVVNPAAAGFITVYPCDVARPLSSNVNYIAGQVVANGVISPVSADGKVCFFSSVATDLVVDLAGWFAQSTADTFVGATPLRLVDTRDGTGGQLGKLDPTSQLKVLIRGESLSVSGVSRQIPTSAIAAALNVTIVNPDASGFATVWPCSAARPLASNLNFVAGQVVANNVVAPIGNDGDVCFFTNVPADIIVDVSGYFVGESGNTFVGSTPERFVDSRGGIGPEPSGDEDGDGVDNIRDAFPFDGNEFQDTDSDNVGDNADTDDDNDGVPDNQDAFPLDSSRTTAGTPSAQARKLVDDLQLLLAALDEQQAVVKVTTFSETVDLVGNLTEVEVGLVFDGLSLAVTAMSEANDAFELDNTLTTFTSLDSVIVAISTSVNGDIFTVDQTLINDVVIDLQATFDDEITTTIDVNTSAESETISGDATMAFMGSVELGDAAEDAVMLTITQGTATIEGLMVDEFYNLLPFDPNSPLEYSSDAEFTNFHLVLNGEMVSTPLGEDSLSFSGMITIDVNAFTGAGAEIGRESPFAGHEGEIFTTIEGQSSLGSLAVVLDGELEAGDQVIGLTLTLGVDGKNFIDGDLLALGSERALTNYSVNATGDTLTYSGAVDPGDRSVVRMLTAADAIAELEQDGFARSSFMAAVLRIFPGGGATFIDNDISSVANYVSYEDDLIVDEGYLTWELLLPTPLSAEAIALQQSTDVLAMENERRKDRVFIQFEDDGAYDVLVEPLGAAGGQITGTLICAVECFIPGFGVFDGVSDDLTSTNFPTGNATVAVRTNILGLDIADPTLEFEVAFNVDGFETGTFDILVSFGDVTFQTSSTTLFLELDANIDEAFLTNQDGFMMTLERDFDGNITGDISKDGIEYATISEGAGTLLIRFLDGESPNLSTLFL
jgi:hypothetical protein